MNKRRSIMTWCLVLAVLGLIGATAAYVLWPQLQPHTSLKIGDGIFTTRVAATDQDRHKGLSGTHELRESQAMLFVFDTDDKWKIVMRDMNYAIDIVWLDRNKEVVYIVKNAPPESYPFEEFIPKKEARYVVELPAGTVSKKRIEVGATAMFDENNIEGLKL